MSQLEEIKSKLNIVDLVTKYVPDLKQSGRNYKGLCPFHSEKSPSFTVNPELGIFKCFGCGESGDAISFIQKIDRIEFRDALEKAAEMTGVQITSARYTKNPAEELRTKKIKEAHQLAANYYHYLLTTHASGKNALEYATKRQINPELAKHFLIGYAPGGDNLIRFLTKKGYNPSELVEFGLAVTKSGRTVDKFSERLMFPIFNVNGEIVAFSGRTLRKDGIPKYLNSPETEIYKKSNLPYGLFQAKDAARKKNFIVLFEGNVDIINSHRLGVENVACPLGTALTIEQLQIIKRYASTVYFAFDNDQAGYKALLRGIGLAESIGMKHRAIDIKHYQDADEFMNNEPTEWQNAVDSAENSLDIVIQKLTKQYDLASASDKQLFRDEMLAVILTLQDQVEIEHYLSKIAALLSVEVDILKAQLNGRERPKTLELPAVKNTHVVTPVEAKKEHQMLALILQLPELSELAIDPTILKTAAGREIYQTIIADPTIINNLEKLNATLTDEARQLFFELISQPLPNKINLVKEIRKLYRDMVLNLLRTRIMELQKRLEAIPDDEETINNFNELTNRIKQIMQEPDVWPVLS